MSWMQKLYETYDNCQSLIGYSTDQTRRPLLPICHIAAQAHIEMVIDAKSRFVNARVVTDRSDATTIVPCTEGSAGRAGSKPECHPLCDTLQYVAGDFALYGGSVTSGFAKDPEEPHRQFLRVLTAWCASEYAHPKAQAVLDYVEKDRVVRDLAEHGVLFVGADGKLSRRAEKQRQGNVSDIFSVVTSQDKALVRWQVQIPGVPESKVWRDKTLWESWAKYYLSTKSVQPLCLVTGKNALIALQHARYIRMPGDGAKLISANDTSGFTFRGRFDSAGQACSVSLEISQKAHNALTWLISRQGQVFFVRGDGGRLEPSLTVVAWATSGALIPKPTDDPMAILGLGGLPGDQSHVASTAQDLALRLKKKIAGYAASLGDTTGVVVMGMDSATPGRMAITYYRELTGSDFLRRIENWHESCAWMHSYGYDKETRQHFICVGAPAPADIAEAAYGSGLDDKLKKSTVERILPCIIDGQRIPRDLVDCAVRRASNRVGMDRWEWNKTLSIACALYRYHARKENYDMALEPERTTRDYLYGRLLALADSLEQWALNEAGEDRQTTAARLMTRFSEHPYSTWRTIELALGPYKARLGRKANKRQMAIDEVTALFEGNDFTNDKRLSGEFLLGYHCQRRHLAQRQKDDSPR